MKQRLIMRRVDGEGYGAVSQFEIVAPRFVAEEFSAGTSWATNCMFDFRLPMPGMDGLQLQHRLRTDGWLVPPLSRGLHRAALLRRTVWEGKPSHRRSRPEHACSDVCVP
jgi:hypothetical protein